MFIEETQAEGVLSLAEEVDVDVGAGDVMQNTFASGDQAVAYGTPNRSLNLSASAFKRKVYDLSKHSLGQADQSVNLDPDQAKLEELVRD